MWFSIFGSAILRCIWSPLDPVAMTSRVLLVLSRTEGPGKQKPDQRFRIMESPITRVGGWGYFPWMRWVVPVRGVHPNRRRLRLDPKTGAPVMPDLDRQEALGSCSSFPELRTCSPVGWSLMEE
ncbi:Hypothetical predicted protein [Xyrichtys novacula]|uniref:Secreted protein n=1 Tax=Xyrichtys novacula TaxID=13765 RepID=A0AAV1FTB6_XYRNO|nr:Hypothetical predicted protein [Xyrichtys novacula]